MGPADGRKVRRQKPKSITRKPRQGGLNRRAKAILHGRKPSAALRGQGQMRRLAIFFNGSLSALALRRTAKVVRFRALAIISVAHALKTRSRSSLSRSGVQGCRGVLFISLRLQPICNCLGPIFLKITCICLARERTTVSVRFIRMPIAVELSPLSAKHRSVSSSACVHGREAKCSGSVIGPRALRLKANHGLSCSIRPRYLSVK
jgi:hypothetical protein